MASIVEEVTERLRRHREWVRNTEASQDSGTDELTAFCQQIINAPRDPHEAAFADVIRKYYEATMKMRERDGEARAKKRKPN